MIWTRSKTPHFIMYQKKSFTFTKYGKKKESTDEYRYLLPLLINPFTFRPR